jgi:aminoglycoside 6-adenylyltransferase
VAVDAFLEAFVGWAEPREDVHAVLLVGSHARIETPADEWSDVDLVLVVDDPYRYLADEGWVDAFGLPLVTFLEPIPVGRAFERRVLYEGGLDVDIVVVTPEWIEAAAVDPATAGVLARGYRVLLDRLGLEDLAARAASVTPPPGVPAEPELRGLAADFWYHAVWAARKLARGDLLTAKRSVDSYLKERLLTMLTWHAKAGDPELDTWHEARFAERWADRGALEALPEAYASYDAADVSRALVATMDIFERLERETAERLGYGRPPDRDAVRALVAQAVATGTDAGSR